jgi:8-oxo-dGTP pyrophosphatase MutT (NUDIX family)
VPVSAIAHYFGQEKTVLLSWDKIAHPRKLVTNLLGSAKLQAMVREISAGGVVIRKRNDSWWMAAIEPPGEAERTATDAVISAAKKWKPILALPKGLVDPHEKPNDTAVREVFEETGVVAQIVAKLDDIKYVYSRSWGDRQRVFKIVSFYLMRYRSGRINDVSPEMRIEVARARWVPLVDAPKLLAYRGERQMAQRAVEYVEAHPDVVIDK